MESLIQIILIVSVIALTAIFITVGVWVVLILKELKSVVKKVGQVGDNLEETANMVKSKVREGLTAATVINALAAVWANKDKMTGLIPGIKKDRAKTTNKATKANSLTRPVKKASKRRLFFRRK